MRRFHLFFGWIIFIVFLLTGQYMRLYHNRLAGIPDGVRMLYRSRHIYILLAALLNIGLGIYFSYAPARWRRVLQIAGSVVIVITTLLLIPAFFYDPGLGPDKTVLSYFGIIGMAIGMLLHFIGRPTHREIRTQETSDSR
jgi:hypothetical protein